MAKIPRDLSGMDLCVSLRAFGYTIERQSGSHIRISSSFTGQVHKITVPNHDPIKIGTLNNILNDLANFLKISKDDLVKKIF